MKKIFYFLFAVILATGCSVEPIDQLEEQEALLNLDAKAQKENPHAGFDVPFVEAHSSTDKSLQVRITAGETGATGGLSIRWMTLEEYEANGWNDDLGGHVLLNGHANEAYSLQAGEEYLFSLEDHISGEGDSWNRNLECGQTYVFIVQAHQDGKIQKSEYSDPVEFSTMACEVIDDPCDRFQNIVKSECLSNITNANLLGITNYYKNLIFLNTEFTTITGTYNPTLAELLTQFQSQGVGTFSTTYTVETADCGLISFDVSVTVEDCQ